LIIGEREVDEAIAILERVLARERENEGK